MIVSYTKGDQLKIRKIYDVPLYIDIKLLRKQISALRLSNMKEGEKEGLLNLLYRHDELFRVYDMVIMEPKK